MRPPSPSFKLLASSTDAKSAIDLVISQVASNDLTTSIQALAQVDREHSKICNIIGQLCLYYVYVLTNWFFIDVRE